MRAAALLLLFLSACATWKPPTRTETALIAASVLLVEADCAQTMHARMTLPGFRERNPLLGSNPSHAMRLRLSRNAELRLMISALYGALPCAIAAIGPKYLPCSVITDWRCLTRVSGFACANTAPATPPSASATTTAIPPFFIDSS